MKWLNDLYIIFFIKKEYNIILFLVFPAQTTN
jgi:hypothetical protein